MTQRKWFNCDGAICKSESRDIDSDNWIHVAVGDIWWKRQRVMDRQDAHFCCWSCLESFCTSKLK